MAKARRKTTLAKRKLRDAQVIREVPIGHHEKLTVFHLSLMPAVDCTSVGIHASGTSGRLDIETLAEGDLLLIRDALDDWFEKRGIYSPDVKG